MKCLAVLFGVLFGILTVTAQASTWQSAPQVATLFDEAGLEGTFVVLDTQADVHIGHDETRARTRFIPASTFKIPNSLIGLASGAVASADEVLPYGGQPQPFPQWEKDMSLREAIPISNVPIYQELARRIGLSRMQDAVTRLEYGNEDIGTQVDQFWLQGPLKISAVEQTQFLYRLTQAALPVPPTVQATVREMVLLEQGEDWALYGKTGWAMGQDPEVAWWVGWVTRGDAVYPFALNITVRDASDGEKRIPAGKAALRALGILPAP